MRPADSGEIAIYSCGILNYPRCALVFCLCKTGGFLFIKRFCSLPSGPAPVFEFYAYLYIELKRWSALRIVLPLADCGNRNDLCEYHLHAKCSKTKAKLNAKTIKSFMLSTECNENDFHSPVIKK